jgi:hypothetical protein
VSPYLTWSEQPSAKRSSRTRARPRASALTLSSVTALGATVPLPLPAQAAAGAGRARGIMRMLEESANAAELLHRLTLSQLAGLLGTSPAALVAEIEALSVSERTRAALGVALQSPRATLAEMIADMTADGVGDSAARQLLSAQLGTVAGDAGKLERALRPLLVDGLGGGHRGSTPTGRGFALGSIEHLGVTAVATEHETSESSLALAIAQLGDRHHRDAARSSYPDGPLTARRDTSPSRSAAPTKLLGLPNGVGGLTLTTIGEHRGDGETRVPASAHSLAPAIAGDAVRLSASGPLRSDFSIVSIKLAKRGVILETVRVPLAGRLDVRATAAAHMARADDYDEHANTIRSIAVTPVHIDVERGHRAIQLRRRQPLGRATHVLVSLASSYVPVGEEASTQINPRPRAVRAVTRGRSWPRRTSRSPG